MKSSGAPPLSVAGTMAENHAAEEAPPASASAPSRRGILMSSEPASEVRTYESPLARRGALRGAARAAARWNANSSSSAGSVRPMRRSPGAASAAARGAARWQ